ncbi:MAG: glucose-6-phosphate isomerase, partial [Endomicrobium sp.]|nr:glucose-6-phosphate isomerase [Endomicrobium sp.]
NSLLEMAAKFFNIPAQELKDKISQKQKDGAAPRFVFEVNNGASPFVWNDVFAAFGIDINNVTMRNEGRDTSFGVLTSDDRGAPEPNSKNLANLRKYIESLNAKERPIFGGATDVDSDRVGTIMYTDKNGQIKELTPNHIGLIMAYAIAKSKGKFAANEVFVRASPTAHLLDYLVNLYGANTISVNVGVKWIAEKINDPSLNVQLGMEGSGTILFRDWIYDKDGPMANMITYLIPIVMGQSYSEILDEIYEKAGYEFNFVEAKADLGKTEEEKADTKKAAVNFFKTATKEQVSQVLSKLTLDDGSPALPEGLELVSVNHSDGLYLGFRNTETDEIRATTGKMQTDADEIIYIQMRASGTENAVRIYAESYDEKLTKRLVDLGQQITTKGNDTLSGIAAAEDAQNSQNKDAVKKEFDEAFNETLDSPTRENTVRLINAAYNMSVYKADGQQEQERIKGETGRAALFLWHIGIYHIDSFNINDYSQDEQFYEKWQHLMKISADYKADALAAVTKENNLLLFVGFPLSKIYGYEFDKETLINIGAVLNDATWVNAGIGRKNMNLFFDNIKKGDLTKAAKVLEKAAPKDMNKQAVKNRINDGFASFRKSVSTKLFSFSPFMLFFFAEPLTFGILLAVALGLYGLSRIISTYTQSKMPPEYMPQYGALENHYTKFAQATIKEMRSEDSGKEYKRELQGKDTKLLFDFSLNNVNQETIDLLLDLAKAAGLKEFIDNMFSGEKINTSEDRAVLHTALRNVEIKNGQIAAKSSIYVYGEDIMPNIVRVLNKMRNFAGDVKNGKWRGATDKPVKHVISIGIGGSDLGPSMATQSLSPYADENIKVHYLSNIDPAAWEKVKSEIPLSEFDSVLVIVQSKTFTTQETITNANAVKSDVVNIIKKLSGNTVSEDDIVKKHFVAVSTAKKEVEDFGIDTENMFEFWDFVGGRFSIWSAIGMPLVLSVGFDTFFGMLNGANEMDIHFQTADFKDNIPVILGMLWVWYINFYKYNTHAVIPYSELYASFPRYLQQLLMESLGKSVDKDGNPVDYATGAAVLGEAATNFQHAGFQMFHQGTSIIPTDFIASLISPTMRPGLSEAEMKNIEERHALFFSNVLAQREAFAMGRDYEEVKAEVDATKAKAIDLVNKSSLSEAEKKAEIAFEEQRYEAIKPQKAFEGNRPSNLIVFDKMNPESLGMLIALYEHVTAVQSLIWKINAFDQWGVELGKKLAKILQAYMLGKTKEKPEGFSESTNYWLDQYNEAKKAAEAFFARAKPKRISVDYRYVSNL